MWTFPRVYNSSSVQFMWRERGLNYAAYILSYTYFESCASGRERFSQWRSSLGLVRNTKLVYSRFFVTALLMSMGTFGRCSCCSFANILNLFVRNESNTAEMTVRLLLLLPVIDTARIVCQWKGRAPVRPSVPSIDSSNGRWRVCC